MSIHRWLAVLAAICPLAACANPDSVLFVTVTSIGIDVDSKPPTASIGYDRIEGYIGPRYDNGAVPPVVASIETAGTVFDPRIRQVYATGAAAVKAVGTPGAAPGPMLLTGDPTKKKLVFFGTTTNLGLKVSFAGEGYPDSLNFGYKRKEFSYIPLGSTTVDGVTTDAYPSVLASIDTTTTATSLHATGLTTKQFFATGQAAETLASDPQITRVFVSIAKEAVTDAAGVQARIDQNSRLDQIEKAVAPNGTFDSARLAKLVDEANAQSVGSVPESVKNATTWAEAKSLIEDNQAIVSSLVKALEAESAGQ